MSRRRTLPAASSPSFGFGGHADDLEVDGKSADSHDPTADAAASSDGSSSGDEGATATSSSTAAGDAASPWQDGLLVVTVLQGTGLTATQRFGKSDPYVKLKLPWTGQFVRTLQKTDGGKSPTFSAAEENRHEFKFRGERHGAVVQRTSTAMLIVEVHNENKNADAVRVCCSRRFI